MNRTTPYANLTGYRIEDFHEFGRDYFLGWLGVCSPSIRTGSPAGSRCGRRWSARTATGDPGLGLGAHR
jgi:hypothetical protein